MRICFAIGAMILASGALAQEHETVVKKPDGTTVTVRTDESGTTIIKNTPAEAAKLPISPGEKEHNDKVYELTKQGGKVELDTAPSKK